MSNINKYPLVKSFKPIEIFLLIFGYSYNIDHNKFLLITNYTIQIIYLAISVYLYIDSQMTPSYQIFNTNILLYITNRVQLFVKILTFIVLFINNFSYKKFVQLLFRRLYSIDASFREFKIIFNYVNNVPKLGIMIFIFSIISLSLLGFTNIAFAQTVEFNWVSFGIFITPLITPFMINAQLIFYTNICWEIKVRFDRLNGLLLSRPLQLSDICLISNLYMELNDCIRLINHGWTYASLGIFGVPFTSITSNIFVLIYFVVYSPDRELIWQRAQFYCIVFWLVYHAIQIFIAIIVCNEIILASQETRILFTRFHTGHVELEARNDMDLIVLQFQHQSAHFTAYGFFDIDDRLIFSMVSAVTTYVVILLQFDAGSDLGNSFTLDAYKS